MLDPTDTSLASRIAMNVKVIRTRKQLTQQDVAARSQGGITRMALSTSEQGDRVLKIDELPALCLALQVSLTELMEGYHDLPAMIPPTNDDAVNYGDLFAPGPLAARLWPNLEPMVKATVRDQLRKSFNA